MKKYTFSFPKNENYSAKIYKESLMDRVINAYPWMIGKKEEPIYDIKMNIEDDYLTEDAFMTAMTWLNDYAKSGIFSADYDFKDIFGTPVKIFHNFVQIGYTIIPIAPGSLNHLKKETKEKVLEIIIKIKYLRKL